MYLRLNYRLLREQATLGTVDPDLASLLTTLVRHEIVELDRRAIVRECIAGYNPMGRFAAAWTTSLLSVSEDSTPDARR